MRRPALAPAASGVLAASPRYRLALRHDLKGEGR